MSRIGLGLVVRGVLVGMVTLATASSAFAEADTQERVEFAAFLDKVTQTHAEYIRGRPEPFKALWSRASDVTFSAASAVASTVGIRWGRDWTGRVRSLPMARARSSALRLTWTGTSVMSYNSRESASRSQAAPGSRCLNSA